MSSTTTQATPGPHGAGTEALDPVRAGRALGRLALVCIAGSLLVMIAASVLRSSWMFPHLSLPAAGPPWASTSWRVPSGLVIIALWLAGLLGTAGVTIGLLALHRGARPSVRLPLLVAAVAIATLTVLPPVGSSDAFDYAAYGRIAALGHSPYIVPPSYLRHAHGAFAPSVPRKWQHQVSVYGPLATAEQFLAAKLGGASIARVTFWLKLWAALAFGAIALAIDRLLRSDPSMRLRAHLLWTVNPLLIWVIVAAGHLDVLAAAAGLLGLLMPRRQGDDLPSMPRFVAAGALIGVAGSIKINYLLLGLGLVWAARPARSVRQSVQALAAAISAALLVLVPGYLWFGRQAIRAVLARRNQISPDNFYRLVAGWNPHVAPPIMLVAGVLIVVVAILLCWRLPPGAPSLPAIRPAVAISAAWLFFWPYQFPWYDAMIICLLVVYPATKLDWLVLTRLGAGTIASIPGNPWPPSNHAVAFIQTKVIGVLAPLAELGAAVGLLALGASGLWSLRQSAAGGKARRYWLAQ